jgi:transposase-like protein
MSMAGFKSDPIAEHAAVIELAHAVGVWREVEQEAREIARAALARPGVRSDVIAEALEMSRATMYRWLSQHRDTDAAAEPAAGVPTPLAPPAGRKSTRRGQGSTSVDPAGTRAKRAPLTLPGTAAPILEEASGRSAATTQRPTGRQRASAASEAQGAKRPKPTNRKPSQT